MAKLFHSKLLLVALSVSALVLTLVLFFIPIDNDAKLVRVAFPPHLIASLPHWVAIERNLYRDQGLEVTSEPIISSKTMIDALYSGEIDVLPAVSLKDVLVAIEKRSSANSIIFYSHSRMMRSPPFENILVPVNSSIATLKDLRGKNIAVYPGGTSKKVVAHYLASNGVSAEEISIIELPPPEHFGAITRGDIDASHSYEPFRTQYLTENSVRSLTDSLYASLNEPSAIGVSVMSKQFALENVDAKSRFLKAWDAAIEIIREEPSVASQILSSRLKLSLKVASDATRVDATLSKEVNPKMIKETAQSLYEAGVINFQPSLREQLFVD